LVALSELADRLGVGDQDQERAARKALEELRQQKHWLVVFDDAHKPADLIDLVPTGDGEVLITSQSPDWDNIAIPVRVEPFDKRRAVQFLQQRSADKDPDAAALLADLLSGIPLALEQVGAYCRQTHIRLAAYVAQYQLDRTRLLNRGIPSDYRLSITVTWQRSFQLAARRKAAAAQLLRVLSYIDSTNIPRDLPTYGTRYLPRALRRVTMDSVSLNDIIARLSSLSLITADQSGRDGTLRIHRLVQDLLRSNIPLKRQPLALRVAGRLVAVAKLARGVAFDSSSSWSATRWSRAVIYMLGNALPDAGDPRNWSRYSELLPHCLTALYRAEEVGDSSPQVTSLQSAVASYFLLRRDFESARVWESRALKIIRSRLGSQNPYTLLSMQNLANILKAQHKFSEARRLEEDILDVRLWRGQLHRRRFGYHDPDTLRAMHNLAITTYAEGDLLKSREMNEEILAERKRSLGDAHPDTLLSMQNLADILREMDELASSRQMTEDIISTINQTSKDPIAIRVVQNNLALVLRDQGDLVGAHELLRQMLANDKTVFGEDDIMTLQTTTNLGSVLRLEGKLAEARKLLEGALVVLERSYSSDDPIALQASTNLARVLRDQGDTSNARELFEKTFNARKRIYGEDHFLTRPLAAELAQMAHDQDNSDETTDRRS
jgi:tetratricopeptide (TPR) repeat protein